jgi:YD repeat-containing protein
MVLGLKSAYATDLKNVSVFSGNWSTELEYKVQGKTDDFAGSIPGECMREVNTYYTSLEIDQKQYSYQTVSLGGGVFYNCTEDSTSGSTTYFGYPKTCTLPFSYGHPLACYKSIDTGSIYSIRVGAHTVQQVYTGPITITNKYFGSSGLKLKTNLDSSKKRKLLLSGTLSIRSNSIFSSYDFKINNLSPGLISGVYFQDDNGLFRWYGSAEWNFEFGEMNEYFDLVPTMPNGDGTLDFEYISAIVDKPLCDLKIDTLTGISKILPSTGGSINLKGDISDSSGQSITWTLTLLDQTFSGSGKNVDVTWNGKYADGTIVEPGDYSATLTAQTADGKCIDSKTINFTVEDAPDGQCGLYVQFGSSAHMASGNLTHSEELFASRGGAMPAGMTLYYSSLDHANGSLGRGWSHSYDYSLKENANGSVLISEGNWRHKYYTLTNGVYTGQPGNYATLVKNTDGSFTLTHKDGQVYSFVSGKLAAISDRNANSVTLGYSSGNLTTVTDPSGRVITFAYDAANHLTSLTDPTGNSYAFSVGAGLSSVTQPDGGVWRYSYDGNGFMQNKTDPMGNVTSYGYDDQQRVITSSDPEGRSRNIAYPTGDDAVKSTTFTEKDGGQWSYSYDTQKGYLLSKTDPQGGTTSYGYDVNGNRTATTNPDGTSTAATFDNTGNMLSSTDAMGQTTIYSYNTFGQVTTITDPQGGTTAYAYDAKGNMTGLTDTTGATTTYAYDAKGNISKVTDAAGLITNFTYDAKGNLATVTDSSGATTSYSYDTAGNVTSITDAKGAISRFVYDSRNHLIKTIDPNGNATLTSYDVNGNKTSDTDANGNVTRYEYNSKNQLIKTIDALNNATTYSYGGSSCPSCGGGNGEKLTSLTDANGNVTSYLYDQLGRLTKETDPKGNITSYAYDVRNNLTSKTDANGNSTTYSYDATGRLLKKTYPDYTEESFTYDPKGNILSATNSNIAYNFSYDAAGRMISSMDSNGRYLQYSYDNMGKKTKTIYPEGSVVSYAYDTTGRLATTTNGGGRTYSYSYDKLGRRSKLTYPSGASANYSYDTKGNLTSLLHKTSSNATIASYAYTLDKVGNRLTKTDSDTTIEATGDIL